MARFARRSGAFALAGTLALAGLGGAVVGGTSTASPAHAGETPGTYSYWSFEGATGLSDATYGITIDEHPGQQSQIYWSNQVSWNNGPGGYAGMQTNADQDKNLFLFSVWDVFEAEPGSEGSWCERFGGEGEGMSCRIWHEWTPGQTYRFRYQHEGGGWWSMRVRNTSTDQSFVLGRIKVGAQRLAPDSVSWVEYYRWSDPRSSCLTEPYSSAHFDLPVGNGGGRTATVSDTRENTCPGFPNGGTDVVVGASAVTHTLGIGNSVMGPITRSGGKCADVDGGSDADGTPVLLYGCHGGGNQAWVLANDGTVRSKLFACLDAGRSGVFITECGQANSQRWKVEAGQLVNAASGKCLATKGGGIADGTRLVMAVCDGSPAQNWTTPKRP